MNPSTIGILLAALNLAPAVPPALAPAPLITQSTREITAAEALLNVEPGQRVWIITRQARTIAGPLISQSDTSVDVRTSAGVVTVPHGGIIRVEVNDGSNAWRGAAAGAVIGGITLPVIVAIDGCAPSSIVCLNGPRVFALAGLWGAGIGAGAGAIAGAFTSHHRRIYPRRGARTSVAPIFARGRSGVYAAVAW